MNNTTTEAHETGDKKQKRNSQPREVLRKAEMVELHLPWWSLLCDTPSGQRRGREREE